MQPKKEVYNDVKLKRVLTVGNVQTQKIHRIPFAGKWFETFEKPQDRGVWFLYGTSGSGKSTFAMMLAKELAKHYKTFYNTLEEETDDSDFIERLELVKMQDVKKNFFTQKYSPEQLDEYLSRRDSPKVVFIDSVPYFFKRWSDYMEFKNKWSKSKIIILIGHAKGKEPRTDLQVDIKYDAKMKFFATGYLLINQGRKIGPNGGRFIIWKDGYEKLHGANSLKEK